MNVSRKKQFATKTHHSFCSRAYDTEVRGRGISSVAIYSLWNKNSHVTIFLIIQQINWSNVSEIHVKSLKQDVFSLSFLHCPMHYDSRLWLAGASGKNITGAWDIFWDRRGQFCHHHENYFLILVWNSATIHYGAPKCLSWSYNKKGVCQYIKYVYPTIY